MNWNEARMAGVLPEEWKNFERVSLEGEYLRYKNLSGTCFKFAMLEYMNLTDSDLTDACFDHADLYHAILENLNAPRILLRDSLLVRANFQNARMPNAQMQGANATEANFRDAKLVGADFSDADLSSADFSKADLAGADFTGARLAGANFYNANISGAKGIPNQREWLEKHFKFDTKGLIVYKAIGKTDYAAPPHWRFTRGKYLTEIVNFDRTTKCGCGVNFATHEWCDNHYAEATIWRCRIEWRDLADVVVPYGTDGKARCARLKLLERE